MDMYCLLKCQKYWEYFHSLLVTKTNSGMELSQFAVSGMLEPIFHYKIMLTRG